MRGHNLVGRFGVREPSSRFIENQNPTTNRPAAAQLPPATPVGAPTFEAAVGFFVTPASSRHRRACRQDAGATKSGVWLGLREGIQMSEGPDLVGAPTFLFWSEVAA